MGIFLIWFGFPLVSVWIFYKKLWPLALSASLCQNIAEAFISCFGKCGLMIPVEMSKTGSKMISAVTGDSWRPLS